MTPEEQQRINDTLHEDLETRIKSLENRMAEKDLQFAVINTKLTAILWGVGAICTALIGALAKMILT